jgi:hypothetical protein
MAGYTRQSSFSDGDTITAALFNNEYNQLVNAFNVSSGHTHDGSTTGDGGPISTLFSNTLSFGTNAESDIAITFNAASNDGVLTWKEDEDYFEFSDDLLIATTEKIQFRDTAIYINSSTDGQLDLVADTEIQIAATTVDINGDADISGNLGIGGNLTVTGTTTFNGGTITMGDAATDNVVFGADVDSNIIPDDDNTYDLGSSSQEWKDLYVDGIAYLDGINFNGTAITSTAAELNILDGVTASTSDLNILDGVTATTTELNKLDGVTASATDINLIDGITNGTVIASKAIITDSNKDITGGRNITISGQLAAATLDISGDVDVDGTLEADAITVNGTTLAETISDTVGAMVTSNTETGVTVTYDDSDNTLDFVIGTLNQDTTGNAATATALETARTIHGVSFDGTANIDLTEVVQDTVGAMFSSNTETGLAVTYEDSDGTIDLVLAAAQPTVTSLGTLTTLTVDDITINGSTISDAGDLDFDVGGDIILNADGGDIRFRDGSTEVGTIVMDDGSNTFILKSAQSDADIKFNGVDGGSGITALTLDMSDAGAATFNSTVTATGTSVFASLDISGDIDVDGTTNLDVVDIDGAVDFASTTAHAGNATFADNAKAIFGAGSDLQIYHDGTDNHIVADTSNLNIQVVGGGTINVGDKFGNTLLQINDNVDVKLFHGTTPAEKLATTSTGVDVTGTLTATTLAGTLSTAAQTNITSVGTLTSFRSTGIDDNADALAITIDSSENVGIGTASPQGNLHVEGAAGASGGGIIYVTDADNGSTASDALHISKSGDTAFVYNRESSGDLQLGAGNTSSHVVIKSDGRVGIGTTSPDVPFQVEAGQNVLAQLEATHTDGNARMLFKPKDNSGWNIGANDDGSFSIFDVVASTNSVVVETGAAANTLVVDSNSRVGIGTASPGQKLDVAGNITADAFIGRSNISVPTGDASVFRVADNTLALATASTERMRIDSSGLVGIGTTSAKEKLDVSGAGVFTGNHATGTNAYGAAQGVMIHASSSTGFVTAVSNGSNDVDLQLRGLNGGTANANQLVLDSEGGVGIGTASPSSVLHLVGGSATIPTLSSSFPFTISNNGNSGMNIISSGTTNAGQINFGDEGDADAGILRYDHNDNSMRFTTNASEAMRIDSSGNVGIGTTSPSAYGKLAVSGTATQLAINASSGNSRIGFFEAGTGRFYIDTLNGADGLAFVDADGSTERMRITSAGRVGIGETDPDNLLHLKSSDDTLLKLESTDATVRLALTDNGGTSQIKNTDGTLILEADPSDATSNSYLGFEVDGSEVSRFSSSGNLGIGTTSPDGNLHVLSGSAGTVTASTDANELVLEATANVGMTLLTGNSSIARIRFGDGDSNARGNIFYNHSNDSLGFQTAASTAMTIDSSGVVMIGTTDSTQFNNTSGSGIAIHPTEIQVASTNNCLALNHSDGDGDIAKFFRAGTQVGGITVASSSTTYATSSDARLKDVTGSARGLEVINKLNPVAYNWKVDGKADEGLIAQEVLDVVPNAVSGSEVDMYQMDYSKLVVHLVAGIKEQQEQIDALQSEINELKNS